MIYPSILDKGDLIKIISPSDGVKQKKINKYEKALEYLNNKDFNVIEDRFVRNSENGVSSSAINRANELTESIKDKSVKALIACSGGDYLIQILDLINFDIIKNNVKWIQGQSDITTILYYITTKYDIATIYSYNVKTFGDNNLPISMLENNIEILKNNCILQKEYGYRIDDEKIRCSWECITEYKSFEGRIIGGCLECLKDIIGTKYDVTNDFLDKYKDDGIVWYFDIFMMTNEDILRTMWQLNNLGWFKHCKGILIGRLCEEKTYTNTSFKDAIKYSLKDLNVPIIINTDIGHTDPVMTIVNGSYVKVLKKDKYEIDTILR